MEATAASDAMYAQSVGSLLLGANHLGMLDTAPLRAPRRWQVKPDRAGTDLFHTMVHSWPTVGAAEEDKNYVQRFRVDKQTFDMLHHQIEVRLHYLLAMDAVMPATETCS